MGIGSRDGARANLERKVEEAPESTRVGMGESQKPGIWILIIKELDE